MKRLHRGQKKMSKRGKEGKKTWGSNDETLLYMHNLPKRIQLYYLREHIIHAYKEQETPRKSDIAITFAFIYNSYISKNRHKLWIIVRFYVSRIRFQYSNTLFCINLLTI